MDYYQFTAEELAADEYFRAWVCVPTPESDAFWQQFLRDFPERYYQVEDARRLILGLQELHDSNAESVTAAVIWERIEHTIDTLESTPNVRTASWFWRVGGWVAAAVVVLVLGYAWQKGGITPREKTEVATKAVPEWMEAVNSSDKMMLIQLSDGSRVELETNSRLKYPRRFQDDTREVHLEGGAFFDVEKNPKRPFLVFANGLVTRVLGTSFHIAAYQKDPDVTVAVKSGRVSVYADRRDPRQDPESKGIVLTPNQKAVFVRSAATIRKLLVEAPTLLLPPAEMARFVFDAAPAPQVFAALEKAYGIEVVYDEEVLKNCLLTINLTDENLFEKLEVICKVLDADYKLIDGQVIIYGKGGC